VVVRDGELLGQGRHEACGKEHAEINALLDCRRRGFDARAATVYVTLAPCTRHGRQPPCVDGLKTAGVARVVAAIADPGQDDPAPALRLAGIDYRVGCLSSVAEHLHGGFLTRMRTGRPRITGKWAMSLDGCLATASGDSKWISDDDALALSRRRRRAFDAIVVGAGTVAQDNPRLLAKHARQRGPVRVVISASAALPTDSALLADHAPLWLVHGRAAKSETLERLAGHGVELLALDDAHDPLAVAALLGERGLNDVLVEGGATVHGAWLRAGLFDRLECYLGGKTVGGGMPVANGHGAATIAQSAHWLAEQPPRVLGSTLLLRMKRAG
jgi:diaminohydroxyphosphoribosylaminopyrimidine deaminase / 5-amino-6-(5-phosphoribosylamino)uracil reductase